MKSFPNGLTTEVISLESLKKVCNLTNKNYDLEHITHFIYKNDNLFNIYSYEQKKKDWKDFNLSVDTHDDFKRIKWIISNLNCLPAEASMEKILSLSKIWEKRRKNMIFISMLCSII